jgi:hypothetical protein
MRVQILPQQGMKTAGGTPKAVYLPGCEKQRYLCFLYLQNFDA